MQGHDARAGKQLVEFDILRQVSQRLWLRVRIIHEHLTPKAAEHPGHAAADRAAADQPSGGILQLQPVPVVFVVVAAPLALRERRMRFRKTTQHGKDEAHGVLGGGRGIAARGVTDEDAVLGRRLDIGIGRTSPRDDGKFQGGSIVENFLRKRGMIRHIDAHALNSLDDLVL